MLSTSGGEGDADGLTTDWLVVDRIEGETIPRKILRDDEWSAARQSIGHPVRRAPWPPSTPLIRTRIAGLPRRDPLRHPLPMLDALSEVRPALELGVRWLDAHRPPAGRRVTVHGDYRCGNFLIGPEGLRAVLDWELAHGGDPAEDIGWLCAPAWRFGGPGEVGGFGDLEELLDVLRRGRRRGHRARGGAVVAGLRHGEVGHHLRHAGVGPPQRHDPLGGVGRHRSTGLRERVGPVRAARRSPRTSRPRARWSPVTEVTSPFGRPTAAELVEAVQRIPGGHGHGHRARGGRASRPGSPATRCGAVERQLTSGPAIASAHADRLCQDSGFADDAALAASIRRSDSAIDWETVGAALASSAHDQLLVANPSYLPAATRRPGPPTSGSPREIGPGCYACDALQHRAAPQAADDHEDPGVVERLHGGLLQWLCRRWPPGTTRPAPARSAGTWRTARCRWRSAPVGAVRWLRHPAKAA